MTFLLSSAACTLCSLFQDKDLLEIFPFLEKTRKTAKKKSYGNMWTGTEIVNPCIKLVWNLYMLNLMLNLWRKNKKICNFT